MRLFFAFEPPEDIRNRLARIVSPAKGIRVVSPDRMHVTLRYVGNVSPEVCGQLGSGLRALSGPLGTAQIRGTGVFPSIERARVVWAGVEPNDEVVALQKSIETLCRDAGIPPDPKPWRPHITLARFKTRAPADLERMLGRNADLITPPFPVDSVMLYDSRTLPDGPEYVPVAVRAYDVS